jgi:hypothetical protein
MRLSKVTRRMSSVRFQMIKVTKILHPSLARINLNELRIRPDMMLTSKFNWPFRAQACVVVMVRAS